jgi:NAD-dependent dihydropyrimidine dehydrogenase PreA subunit
VAALFIDVKVEPAVAKDPGLVKKLVEACPVDIYAANPDGTLAVVEANLDECTLCDLCVQAAPPGTVSIVKKYE